MIVIIQISIGSAGVEESHQPGALLLPLPSESFSVIGVYQGPLLFLLKVLRFLEVDEVAAVPIAAEALLCEGVAPLGLVGPIGLHVYPQLLRPMRELALVSIGAEPLFGEVPAERALGLGGALPVCGAGGRDVVLGGMLEVVVIGRDVGVRVGEGLALSGRSQQLALYHSCKLINDYRDDRRSTFITPPPCPPFPRRLPSSQSVRQSQSIGSRSQTSMNITWRSPWT